MALVMLVSQFDSESSLTLKKIKKKIVRVDFLAFYAIFIIKDITHEKYRKL